MMLFSNPMVIELTTEIMRLRKGREEEINGCGGDYSCTPTNGAHLKSRQFQGKRT
jgi:hypothetical protein